MGRAGGHALEYMGVDAAKPASDSAAAIEDVP
jgi:hypothetical protein